MLVEIEVDETSIADNLSLSDIADEISLSALADEIDISKLAEEIAIVMEDTLDLVNVNKQVNGLSDRLDKIEQVLAGFQILLNDRYYGK